MDVSDTDLAVSVDETQLDGTKALLTDNWGQIRTGQTGDLDAGTCHRRGGTARDGELRAPACYFLAIGDNVVMAKPKKEYSYQVNLIPEAEGGYTVVVPLLPGCLSYGSTIEEATANAREAIELHLENLAAHHEPIPLGNESVQVFTTTVHVSPTHV